MSHPKAPDQTFTSERFWGRVVGQESGCWEWTGTQTNGGYGKVTLSQPRRSVYAHRVVYEALVGPIPEGAVLHHLCQNKCCVNPSHLEVMTRSDHAREHRPEPMTHCKRNHDLTTGNVYRYGSRRMCRQCILDRMRKR